MKLSYNKVCKIAIIVMLVILVGIGYGVIRKKEHMPYYLFLLLWAIFIVYMIYLAVHNLNKLSRSIGNKHRWLNRITTVNKYFVNDHGFEIIAFLYQNPVFVGEQSMNEILVKTKTLQSNFERLFQVVPLLGFVNATFIAGKSYIACFVIILSTLAFIIVTNKYSQFCSTVVLTLESQIDNNHNKIKVKNYASINYYDDVKDKCRDHFRLTGKREIYMKDLFDMYDEMKAKKEK